jgi:hypothetical protein
MHHRWSKEEEDINNNEATPEWFNRFSEENCHITCKVTAHKANISTVLSFWPEI